MPDVVNTGLAIIGIVAAVLVLFVLTAVISRIAGHGWTRGRLRAQRGVVLPPGSTHGHDPRPASIRGRVAPPRGGVCVVGHYVKPGTGDCRMGHMLSPQRSDATPDDTLALAQAEDAEHREATRQRMAAGGW